MTTIAIRLHPAEVLNANQRMHWACKARLTSNLRDWGSFAWNRAGRPHMNRAHVTVTLGYPDRRKRDAHNLMATVKPLLDGMVSPGVRGILPDDDDAHLEGPDLRVGDVTPGFFTFTFRFEELPDE